MVFSCLAVISLLGLLHTYIFYPWYVNFRFKRINTFSEEKTSDFFPTVSVIMSVYNEELVLLDKLKAISKSNYLPCNLNVYIGSDCSTDNSNVIISEFSRNFPIQFFSYHVRRGKTRVINDLVKNAITKTAAHKNHILIFTDANVLINKDTFKALVQPFDNEQIDLVDATMIPVGLENDGISRAEGSYINLESNLKYQEGAIWGMTVGPFGGCFALRSTAFEQIPEYLVVDDLYLALKVLTRNKKAITSKKAQCFEKVSSDIKEEFKRKIRISSGNWQLMGYFPRLWMPPFNSTLSTIFISHKILRWMSPFFILIIYTYVLYLGILDRGQTIYYFLPFTLILPYLLDQCLKLFKIPFYFPRKVHYFLIMNFGLLLGFFKYLNGTNSNVWEPPKRK